MSDTAYGDSPIEIIHSNEVTFTFDVNTILVGATIVSVGPDPVRGRIYVEFSNGVRVPVTGDPGRGHEPEIEIKGERFIVVGYCSGINGDNDAWRMICKRHPDSPRPN